MFRLKNRFQGHFASLKIPPLDGTWLQKVGVSMFT